MDWVSRRKGGLKKTLPKGKVTFLIKGVKFGRKEERDLLPRGKRFGGDWPFRNLGKKGGKKGRFLRTWGKKGPLWRAFSRGGAFG